MLAYDYMIGQLQYEDLVREAEQERFVRAAGLLPTGRGLKAAAWVSDRVMDWRCRLALPGREPAYCRQPA